MKDMSFVAGLVLVLGLGVLPSCEDSDDSESCTAGNFEDCECSAGIPGTRTCSDLEDWGECSCTNVRFCTEIINADTGEDITFHLTYGEGETAQTITITSNSCDAPVGAPCLPAEAGVDKTLTVTSPEAGDLGVHLVPALKNGTDYFIWLSWNIDQNEAIVYSPPFPIVDQLTGDVIAEECSDFTIMQIYE